MRCRGRVLVPGAHKPPGSCCTPASFSGAACTLKARKSFCRPEAKGTSAGNLCERILLSPTRVARTLLHAFPPRTGHGLQRRSFAGVRRNNLSHGFWKGKPGRRGPSVRGQGAVPNGLSPVGDVASASPNSIFTQLSLLPARGGSESTLVTWDARVNTLDETTFAFPSPNITPKLTLEGQLPGSNKKRKHMRSGEHATNSYNRWNFADTRSLRACKPKSLRLSGINELRDAGNCPWEPKYFLDQSENPIAFERGSR